MRRCLALIFVIHLCSLVGMANGSIVNGDFETGVLSPFWAAAYNRGPVSILTQETGNKIASIQTGPVLPPNYSTGIFSPVFSVTQGNSSLSFDFSLNILGSEGSIDSTGGPDMFTVSLIQNISGGFSETLLDARLNPNLSVMLGGYYVKSQIGPSMSIPNFYTVTAGLSEYIGQEFFLGFNIYNSNDGYVTRADIDNVQLGPVNAVPIPAAILLLGSGLIGLIGLRKKPQR